MNPYKFAFRQLLAAVLALSASNTFAQIATVYPGGYISFGSATVVDGNGPFTGCPGGGSFSAFVRLMNANGWYVAPDQSSSESSTTDNGATINSRFKYIATSVHPETKRMHRWIIDETVSSTRRKGGISSCRTGAVLQAERVDDAINVEIGVRLTNPLNKGEQVAPISVGVPRHCSLPWGSRSSDQPNGETFIFDCVQLGISPKTVSQEKNLSLYK